MPAGKHLTEYEVGQVVAYRESGYSIRKIAMKTKRSTKAVFDVLKDPENYGKNKRTGRPKKL